MPRFTASRLSCSTSWTGSRTVICSRSNLSPLLLLSNGIVDQN